MKIHEKVGVAPEESELPDNFDELVLDNFIWTNRRFPQGGVATAGKFAAVALLQRDFDPMKVGERMLSKAEVRKLGDAMDNMHAAYGVAYATKRGTEKVRRSIMEKLGIDDPAEVPVDEVTDERLKGLWNTFKINALQLIAIIADVDPHTKAWPQPNQKYDVNSRKQPAFMPVSLMCLRDVFEDTEVLGRAQAIARALIKAIESEEGLRIGKEIREESRRIAKARIVPGDSSYERVYDLFEKLRVVCIKEYVAAVSPDKDEMLRINKMLSGLVG